MVLRAPRCAALPTVFAGISVIPSMPFAMQDLMIDQTTSDANAEELIAGHGHTQAVPRHPLKVACIARVAGTSCTSVLRRFTLKEECIRQKPFSYFTHVPSGPRFGFTAKTCGATFTAEESGGVPAPARSLIPIGKSHAKPTLENTWSSARAIGSLSTGRPPMGYPIDMAKTIAGAARGPQPVPPQVNEALELCSFLVPATLFSEKCRRLASPALSWSPSVVDIQRVFRRRQISVPGILSF
jgi:hypothetical protein